MLNFLIRIQVAINATCTASRWYIWSFTSRWYRRHR